MVSRDVPPFCTAACDRARLRGLNLVGLRRRGFTPETILALKRAYRTLFGAGRTAATSLQDAIKQVRETSGDVPEVARLAAFLESSERGISRGASR
jgi:UDP-N-acetylglucosamine acyltransferase